MKPTATRMAAAALALLLGACGTCDVGGGGLRDHATAGKMVFTGPLEQRDGACHADPDGRRLRSEVDKTTGATVHWVDIRMEWTGTAWSHWIGARDAGGTSLTLGMAHRRTGECSRLFGWGCAQQEEVSAMIPDALLRARAEDEGGLTVAFTRNSGFDTTIRIGRDQIRAHLDRIGSWQSARTR